MELEKAKKIYYELKNVNKNVIINIDTKFFLEFAETVLKELDNFEQQNKRFYESEIFTSKQLKQIEETQKNIL